MKIVAIRCRALAAMALAALLSGCGVQHMQMQEQQVQEEWLSVILVAHKQLDAVSEGKAGSDRAAQGLIESLRQAEKKAASSIPAQDDLLAGASVLHQVEKVVDARLAEAAAKPTEAEKSTVATVTELRARERMYRKRYAVAAGTYNDILRLYPSKWLAKAMMQRHALTFADAEALKGPVSEASMLDKLHAAKGT